jgi:hypothetical protein
MKRFMRRNEVVKWFGGSVYREWKVFVEKKKNA